MKKFKSFKLLWQYLKKEKLKLVIYILAVILTYLPSLLGAFIWGKSLELLITKEFYGFVKYLAIMIGIYLICYTVIQLIKDRMYNKLEITFTKNVSKDLYQKLDNMPAIAFENFGVGEFINRIYTDPDRVMELLSQLIKLICKSTVVVIVFVIAFKVSLVFGFEITLFALIMGFISYKYFPKIKKTQESIKAESDAYVKEATENISGIREIKSLGIKQNVEEKIFNRIDSLFKNHKDQVNYETSYSFFNNLLYFLLQFIILFTAGYYFTKGNISYSLFIVIESYIWRIDEVVESISEFGANYNKVSVSLKRIDEIINNRLYDDEQFGKINLRNINGIIEFNNVNFRYTENEQNVLQNLCIKLEPNKKIAIVGRSGNGKSTIFNLLLRYFDVSEGEIMLDKVNIKNLSESSLRRSISIIRQSPFLFNLSVFENFKLVKKDVTLKEIRQVCKKAYIDEYIMGLPDKYDAIIGEGGINLSGGQKQRLAIARTLLLNTKIILFDEATSALDNESQEYIKKTINDLVKNHTVIIVAHRLSTIVDADIINVIDKGMLAASGTHKELLVKSEVYQKLYTTENLDL